MKRLIQFIVLFFWLTGITQGQIISGKITDRATGNPLPDAAIVIKGSAVGTLAGKAGEFNLKTMTGKQIIEVRYIGYTTEQHEVNPKYNQNIALNFQLTREINEQEQIVVTANKLGMNRNNVPMNVTVISQKEIEQSTESNILPLLSSNIPGFFVTERGVTGFGLAGGSAGKISIRGVGGSDASFPVLLLIDGQPQFMGMMGHPIPDSYVTSDVEKVEVVKGPASVLYGTNAMGGAINLITRKQKNEGLTLQGRLMYGSFDTRKYSASAGYRKKRFSIVASLNHDQTDGDRPNSDFAINNGYLKLAYEISSHFSIEGNGSYSQFKAFDPGSIYHPNPSAFDNKSQWVDIARTNTYFTLSNKYERVEGGLKAYFMKGDHDIYDGWKSHDENMGVSLFQGIRLFENNLLSVGVDMKKYGGKGMASSLGQFSGKWLEVNEQGIYAIMQHTFFEKLTLNAGTRYDNHSLFGGQWVPQFGAALQLFKASTIKTSVAKGFRNPSIRELYLFPPANNALLPENMWNYELTFVQVFAQKRGKAEVTVYRINGDNLILVEPNPTPPPPFKNQNSGKFAHEGVEVDLRYLLKNGLNLNFSYSFLDMNFPKTGAPESQLYAGGNYRLGKLDVAANLQQISNLYTKVQPATAMIKESYTLLNSKVSYFINHNINFFLSAENLLNQKYQVQYGYPMPGTTLFAGMNFSL